MEETSQKRIWELDFLRGFSIILMVFDHLLYDLNHLPALFSNFYQVQNPFFNSIFKIGEWYWYSDLRAGGHYVFVAFFLIVSGISFNFSHNNLRRFLKLMLVALAITAITWGLDAAFSSVFQFLTIFGIIHLIAIGALLTLLLRKIWNNDLFILSVGAVLIILGFGFRFWDLDYDSELTFGNFFPIVLGVKAFGADHFGLAPFAGMIIFGSAIGKFFYPEKKSLLPGWDRKWSRPFMYAGRKSLWIFITHQLVLFGIIYLVGYLLGYRI